MENQSKTRLRMGTRKPTPTRGVPPEPVRRAPDGEVVQSILFAGLSPDLTPASDPREDTPINTPLKARANKVIDTSKPSDAAELAMEIVETPDAKTIEDVAAFFHKAVSDFVKTLIDESYDLVVMKLNHKEQQKLKNY